MFLRWSIDKRSGRTSITSFSLLSPADTLIGISWGLVSASVHTFPLSSLSWRPYGCSGTQPHNALGDDASWSDAFSEASEGNGTGTGQQGSLQGQEEGRVAADAGRGRGLQDQQDAQVATTSPMVHTDES